MPFWNLNVQYCVHKSLPVVNVLWQAAETSLCLHIAVACVTF